MEKGLLFQFKEEERLLVRVFSGVQVFSFVSFVERLFLAGLYYMHLSFPTGVEDTRPAQGSPGSGEHAGAGDDQAGRGSGTADPGNAGQRERPGALIRAVMAQQPATPEDGHESFEMGVEFQGLDPTQLIMLQNLIYEA